MAKKQTKVYLGYEEEIIKEKNLALVNYSINKIGGLPDWPQENIQVNLKCPLCGLYRLLVVQCYAPLEGSCYHRTLYLFACISPNCWTQSESWLCIRAQVKDNSTEDSSTIVAMPSADSNQLWCTGADEWDENDNGDSANGNIMNVDNAPSPIQAMFRNSDEDDESNSIELDAVEEALENLQMYDAHNANLSPVQGAVGAIGAPVAAAELEGGDEPGLVTVDTPTAPLNDVQALLHQTAELPQDLRSRLISSPLQFVSKFIYVEEEWNKSCTHDAKVLELLNKYKRDNEIEQPICDKGAGAAADEESYEEATPLHGDRLFHAFLTRLRENPGQILRYTRNAPPVLGAPLPNTTNSPEFPGVPSTCNRCGEELICELQLVPEFASALVLHPTNAKLSHLHFLSVLVFTCSQSCWQPQDTYIKETVLFQPEVV